VTHTRKVRLKGFQDSVVISDSRHLFPLPQALPGAHVAPIRGGAYPRKDSDRKRRVILSDRVREGVEESPDGARFDPILEIMSP